ncbi:MAG TPA: hypothetical protein VM536_07865 [Chloroflexia bacterium]|nr:hypothetical protein [Chloroflexia bacterium]
MPDSPPPATSTHPSAGKTSAADRPARLTAAPEAAAKRPKAAKAPVARRGPRAPRAPRDPRPAPPASTLWGVSMGGAGALLGMAGLLATHPVETLTDPADPVRLGVLALLVAGPLAIFWAAGQALRLGWFWLSGTAAWALLGYTLIFVPPPASGTAGSLAVAGFLLLLFVALVAGLTPPLYALGWALFTHRLRRQDLRRAVRQAVLLALYLVACLGMVLFGLFNGLNALLFFAVLALAEFFFLSRS